MCLSTLKLSLGPEGLLADKLESYEYRPEQNADG